MSRVLSHYDDVLGPIYTWTLGDLAARISASESLFRELLGAPALGQTQGARRALDLGCGTGVQSLALGRLGFEVTGVDFSPRVLVEYRERTQSIGAVAIEGDLADFQAPGVFDAAVCLGDTVSHLQSWAAVRAMFRRVAEKLRPGAGFVLASRDHSKVYEGDARFLLVRADATQSLTCFLEDAGEHVRVTDIVHRLKPSETREPSAAGVGTMTASSYLKLRVSPASLEKELEAAGLRMTERRETAGVHVLFSIKP